MSNCDIILIAIGLAMDAFFVSITTGINTYKNIHKMACLSGVVYGVFQGLMIGLGMELGTIVTDIIDPISKSIAIVIFVFIGLNMIFHSTKSEETEKNYSCKVILLLGVATSIDAFAAGFSFSCVKVSFLLAIFVVTVITFMLSIVGVYIGNFVKNMSLFLNKIDIIGGTILLLIALKLAIQYFIL